MHPTADTTPLISSNRAGRREMRGVSPHDDNSRINERNMPISYRHLSLAQIAADLEETLCDLYWNAGRQDLESLVRLMEEADIPGEARPSTHLIELMEELLGYDTEQLSPRAQELMRAAAHEISRLAGSTDAA